MTVMYVDNDVMVYLSSFYGGSSRTSVILIDIHAQGLAELVRGCGWGCFTKQNQFNLFWLVFNTTVNLTIAKKNSSI